MHNYPQTPAFLPSSLKISLPLDKPVVVYPELAKKLGLNEAIILQQLHYWLKQNEDRQDHIVENRVWCYNSVKQWQESFPWWSENTIIRTFESLIRKGLVVKGNHNQHKFNKTCWYTIEYENLVELFRDIYTHNQEIDIPNFTPTVLYSF
jgi:hypothetical protein